MNKEQLKELLVNCIRDIFDAEKQLVKALPKMVKAADSEELKEGIQQHLQETEGQVVRLEKVFELLDTPAKGKPCKAMKGLLDEGAEALEEKEAGLMRDLAIIAAAQKVEHYESSAYGTARTIAEQLGNRRAAELLQQTEDEEVAADENLSTVAMTLYGSAEEDEATSPESGDKRMGAGREAGGSHAKKAAGGRS